jgi:hypothetical protein
MPFEIATRSRLRYCLPRQTSGVLLIVITTLHCRLDSTEIQLACEERGTQRAQQLAGGVKLKKASEYQERARRCRILAASAANREHRGMLSKTASIWESLANDSEEREARQHRISDVEAGNDRTAARDAPQS